MSNYLLEMRAISKAFPGVQALDEVSFSVKPGSVHALLGENGAGKSTLMKVLIGLYRKDAGTIILDGSEKNFHEPRQALEAGVSIIQQELNPVGQMTIAENLFLGREPTNKLFIDYDKLNKMAEHELNKIRLNVNPRIKMKELSAAEMQLVEIAKALSYDSKVIIMDEPTSAIGDKEVDRLMDIIGMLRNQGKGVIYVSHKLEEIFRIADEITVLRDGKHVATKPAEKLDRGSLIRLMIGREIMAYPKSNQPLSSNLVTVNGLSRTDVFDSVDFALREGEILGIFGLMGAGKTEILETLFGIYPADAGYITMKGRNININSPQDAIRHGFALITEDRKKDGIFGLQSIKENISLTSLNAMSAFGFINERKEEQSASEYAAAFDVRMRSLRQQARNLSGGNQQKVILARWLLTRPQILLLDEPTRGIDVGAKREIHRFMDEFVSDGRGIIMASSELPELLGMSDRIVVLKEGQISGIIDGNKATEEKVMELAV